MIAVRGVEITPALRIATTAIDEPLPAWETGQAYLVGERVIRERHIYEALTAHSGIDPLTDSSSAWLALGAVNSWRMFDASNGSRTSAEGGFSVIVQPGRVCNALGLLNCRGTSVTVVVTDPVEGEVYRRTVPLARLGVSSWYDYYFKPVDFRQDIVLLDLPAYSQAQISIAIEGSGAVWCGNCILGIQRTIGEAQLGAVVGIRSFSTKGRDELFGDWTIVKRDFAKTAEFPVWLLESEADSVFRWFAEVRDEPILWIGDARRERTILYGFYTDHSMTIETPTASRYMLEIEGLTQ